MRDISVDIYCNSFIIRHSPFQIHSATLFVTKTESLEFENRISCTWEFYVCCVQRDTTCLLVWPFLLNARVSLTPSFMRRYHNNNYVRVPVSTYRTVQ
jgi:hypothetical protein